MSVHTLKDGRHFVQYRDKSKKSGYARKYFERGPAGLALANDFNAGLGLRTYGRREVTSKTALFVELAQIYLDGRAGHIADDSLKRIYRCLNSTILPRLGNKAARELNLFDMDKYVRDRKKTVKNGTICRELIIIQAVLNFAVDRRVLKYNPVAKYKKPKANSEVIPPPTADEVRKMVDVSPPHLARALTIAYFTGLRVGCSELFRLRWSAFDFNNKVVLITAAMKGGPGARTVPLADGFVPLLRKWAKEDRHRDVYVVRWNGKPVKQVSGSFKRAKRLAGISRKLRPYDFRHAFATALLNQGEDLKSVSEMLGHANTNITTSVYQHTSNEAKRRIVNKLPGLGTTKEKVIDLPKKPLKLQVVK